MRSSVLALCALGVVIGSTSVLAGCGDKSEGDGKGSPSSNHENERSKKSGEPAKSAAAAAPTASVTSAAATPSTTSAVADPAPVASDDPNATGTQAAGANAPSSDGSDVEQYSDQVVQSGTVYTKKGFTIYKSADATTPESGKVGAHTLINLKASHANWLLVEWPSGPGTLSLGWIQEPPHGTDLLPTKDGLNPKLKHADWRLKNKAATPDAAGATKRDIKTDHR